MCTTENVYAVRIYVGQTEPMHMLQPGTSIEDAHARVKTWMTYPVQLSAFKHVVAIAVCEGCDFELHRSKVFL